MDNGERLTGLIVMLVTGYFTYYAWVNGEDSWLAFGVICIGSIYMFVSDFIEIIKAK